MRRYLISALLTLAVATLPSDGQAASLQVTPVMIDVPAPRAAVTVQMRNLGAQPVNAQIRIFRWRQKDGEDELVDTREVVASPPFASLEPGAEYMLRIVRVSKQPVRGEESYRLLVDELPPARHRAGSAVTFVLRYSIPVFFHDPDASPGRLEWSANRTGASVRLTARNSGDRRVRISSLGAHGQDGRGGFLGNGLAGYVLGGSSKHWTAPGPVRTAKSGTGLTITAVENNGPARRIPKVMVAD